MITRKGYGGATSQITPDRAWRQVQSAATALAGAELWIVGPCLIAGLMAPKLLAPALAVAAGFWAIRWVAWGRLTARTAADLPIAFLVLLLPLTMLVTALPEVTGGQVMLLAAGIALYYAIVNWVRTVERERTLVLCLVGVGLLAALIAPVAVTWVTAIKLTVIPAAFYNRLPRLAPIPAHPNVMAGGLVVALPIPLALLMFGGSSMSRRERIASAAAVIGMSAILVLTKSRGALLGAAAAVFVLALLRWRRSWMILALAALLAGLAVWRIGAGWVIEELSATGSTVGGPGRLEIWLRGLYLVQDFPLTGIGMGTFKPLVNDLYPFFLLGPDADIPHAHNLFLQVAVDLGIPGLVAWLALLFLVIFSVWRIYRAGRRQGLGWEAGLGAGLLCSQLAMLVHGTLDAAVWGAHSGMVVWGLWGLSMAAYNLRQSRAPGGNAA